MMVTKKEGAVFDPYQESVISMIEDMFPNIGLTATRGHSTPIEQLHIIGGYTQGFHYPEFDAQDVHGESDVEYEGQMIRKPKWWRTWGEGLHRNIIANPPLAAIVPYDYFKDGVNQKGMLKHASDHIKPVVLDFTKDTCPIDWSQKIDGEPDIERVATCMKQAKISGVPIANIKVEHGNGCVHIDLLTKKEGV